MRLLMPMVMLLMLLRMPICNATGTCNTDIDSHWHANADTVSYASCNDLAYGHANTDTKVLRYMLILRLR